MRKQILVYGHVQVIQSKGLIPVVHAFLLRITGHCFEKLQPNPSILRGTVYTTEHRALTLSDA